MHRGLRIALIAFGLAAILLGGASLFAGPLGPGYAPAAILVGAALLVAAAASLRGGLSSGGPSRPGGPDFTPNLTPPLREPGPSEAPVIRVGQGPGYWNWSPENPLGGSAAWNRYRNPASWDWERDSRCTLRYHWQGEVSERALRIAARRACRAARVALAQRGGVKVHGEARPERGGTLLTLHVDIHSMSMGDANRESCIRAFGDAFARAMPGISAMEQ